jgi:hypothetical protein
MPTTTISANSLKYASGSSWTSGKARQGVYGSTRYEGAMLFSGLSSMAFGNIAISEIKIKLTFGAAGGASNKYVTFYEGAKDSISGSIASMRGDSIGAVYVSTAYNSTKTITFNSSSNASMFTKFVNFFSEGGTILILYVPTTRGTYSGGFCYDYLAVEGAELTFTYEYLQSTGTPPGSVEAGGSATLNITAFNSAYTHNVVWAFGGNSYTQNVAAGATSASCTIPLSWLTAIPNSLSGTASVSLETIDTGGTSLGTYAYHFTITVPSSVVPTISSVTSSPVNDNSVLAGWGIYAQGKTKANLAINGASGAYGSTIKSYSITTSPSIGSASASSMQTGVINATGTVTITGTVTDSRGRTAQKTATISVYAYAAPLFTPVSVYRCTSDGTRNDTDGTYVYLRGTFGCSALSGGNSATCSATVAQVGGAYTTTSSLASGTGVILGGGNIAVDATFRATFSVTDTVGTVTTYVDEISSAAYIMHVKKGGKAIGFGMAAGADDTVSFGWPVILDAALSFASAGSGVTPRAESARNLLYLGQNLSFEDTAENWSAQGFGWAWYTTTALSVTNKPSSYGFLLNIPVTGGVEVHQLYFVQNHGAIYHRGANGSGWGGGWKLLYDSATVVPVANGGTGQTTVAAARNALGLGNTAGALPVANGGTGAGSAKAALTNLGIFYADTLPSGGTDGQICLVPVG